MSKVLLTSALASILILTGLYGGTANAAPLKSDPANLYLDPEEIRPIILDDLFWIVKPGPTPAGRYKDIKTFDVRLLDGQYPVYDINGEVVAYYYIAYVIPGPLPTYDEIISTAMEVGKNLKNKEYFERPHEAFKKYFPYGIYCAHEYCSITPKGGFYGYTGGVPRFILELPWAKDVASERLGSRDCKFVRLVLIKGRYEAYEFSDGTNTAYVPLSYAYGPLADETFTGEDVARDKGKYLLEPDENDTKAWIDIWEKRLRDLVGEINGTGKTTDTPTDFEIPNSGYYGRGPWCYLHQTYYDHSTYWHKNWKNGWEYLADNYPELEERQSPEDEEFALFGTCLPISYASALAYLEETSPTKVLTKNYTYEGDAVAGFGGGEYTYPCMTHLDKTLRQWGPETNRPCNYATYMSLLTGAIYQRYGSFSFFKRGQGTLNGGNMFFSQGYDALRMILTDFKAALYFDTYSDPGPPSTHDIVCSIICYLPFTACTSAVYPPAHSVTVFGYKGYISYEQPIGELGFYDWYSDDWPDADELNYKPYVLGQWNDCTFFATEHRKSNEAHIGPITYDSTPGKNRIIWENDSIRELEIAGYNIIDTRRPDSPLNGKPILPSREPKKSKYVFTTPPVYDADNLAVEIVYKNGRRSVFPCER